MHDVSGSEQWVPEADWKTIDTTIVRLASRKGELDLEIGRWLLAAQRERVDKRLGFGSFLEYADRRLGYEPRITKEKLRVARALEKLPGIAQLLRTGQRSWSAVREIVRVATPETEAAWTARTERMTVRQIETMVAGKKQGDAPSDVKDPLLEPRRVSFDLPPEDFAVWREASEHVRKEIGAAASNQEVLRAMAQTVLGQRPEAQAGYQTALTVSVSCERTWQQAGGEAIEVSPAIAACARCDGEVVGFTQIDEGVTEAPSTDAATATAEQALVHSGMVSSAQG